MRVVPGALVLAAAPKVVKAQFQLGRSPALPLSPARLKTYENGVSPTILTALQSSISTYVNQQRSGQLTEGATSMFAQAVNIYFGNLAETGWNKAADQYLIANQSNFINGNLTDVQAQAVVAQANSFGIPNLTPETVIQQSFLTAEDKSTLVSQIQSSGSAALFATVGSQLTAASGVRRQVGGPGGFSSGPTANIVPLDPPEQPHPWHSFDCKGIAALIMISAFIGNEIAAVVAIFGYQSYC
jgi:hypothetical protein